VHYSLQFLIERTEEVFHGFWIEVAAAALLSAVLYAIYRKLPKVGLHFLESAKRSWRSIAAAMCLPVAIRLACLPWMPPPVPKVHDEFVHLLAADTLVAGRLANPPHPLARHFETVYVLQRPAYASIYPLGQGMVLAAGKLIGHPWAGVLLAVALMSGAIMWMLFGCLPPPWAVLGAILAALAYGLADEWIDSYYGGALCAFGGALVFGALLRLRALLSKRLALIAGVGWSIVSLVRPFESVFTFVVVWTIVTAFAWRSVKQWLAPAAVLALAQMAGVAITAVHNRAVTGSFTTLPYQLSQRDYGVPQTFLGQKPVPEPPLRFPELRQVYDWQRGQKDSLEQRPFARFGAVVYNTWLFFVTPWFSVPLVLALLTLRNDPKLAIAAGILACATALGTLYPFFNARYLAAYACVFMFLIVRGLMLLSHRSVAGKVAACFLVIGGMTMGLIGLKPPYEIPVPRQPVVKQLAAIPGRHVVFVRYGPTHSFLSEWVYNTADIDASRIVWARSMGPADDAEVARYYKDRQTWIADVEANSVRLAPYRLH